MSRWDALFALARRQGGALRVGDGEQFGISPDAVIARSRREGWSHPHRGVVLLPGTPASFQSKVGAALLAVGEPVFASHHTAAYLWGLVASPPAPLELVVPERRRAPRLGGVQVHRSRTLAAQDAASIEGLAVTSVPRTLLDLAGATGLSTLRGLVIDARQKRLAELDEVACRLLLVGPVRGRGRLRQVLSELDEEVCDSVLEHRLRAILRDAGLEPHPAPFPVEAQGRVLHVDVAFPLQRVGIEVDGFGAHSTRRQLEIDHERQNRLVVGGWRIIRVGWDKVADDPTSIVRELRRLLGP